MSGERCLTGPIKQAVQNRTIAAEQTSNLYYYGAHLYVI